MTYQPIEGPHSPYLLVQMLSATISPRANILPELKSLIQSDAIPLMGVGIEVEWMSRKDQFHEVVKHAIEKEGVAYYP
jgi:hypothetical protein